MVAVIHSQWTILKKQLAQIDYFEEDFNVRITEESLRPEPKKIIPPTL